MRKLLITVLFLQFILHLLAQPEPCGQDAEMSSFCADACVICNIDGYTGINNLSATGQDFPNFCTTEYNNMQYIAFIAGSTDLTIAVDVGNCTGSNVASLELGFFESFDCQTFTPITFCDTDIEQFTGQTFSSTVPLTIGQHYYMVIDGSDGSMCEWTFTVTEGTTEVLPLTEMPVINHIPEICLNEEIDFFVDAEEWASLFNWTINGESQSTLSQNPSFSFDAEGEYNICVTPSNVCDEGPQSCSILTVRTIENLNVSEIVCDGECVRYNEVDFCVTGNYTEVFTYPNGCDSTINLELTVLPQAQSNSNVWICNDTVFYIGTTPYDSTGSYSQTILTSMDCDSIVNLDLLVIECEIIGISAQTPVICNGTGTGSLTFSVEQGTPPLTFEYTNINDPINTGTGTTDILDNNKIPNISAGIYTIYITDEFDNDVVILQEVTEPARLELSITASNYNGFNISCFNDIGDLDNDGTLFANVIGGEAPYEFMWSDGQKEQLALNLTNTTYEVTVTDSVGCTISGQFTMSAPSPITADIDFIDPNCDGFDTGVININSIEGGVADYAFSMSPNNFNTDSTYTDLFEGTYDIFIQDMNGCIIAFTDSIFAPDIPVIDFEEGLEVFFGDSLTIQPILNDSSIDSLFWTETISGALRCFDCLEPIARPFVTTDFYLTIVSNDGCAESDTVKVRVIERRRVYIPNVFSPDDNGINDVLNIFGGIEVEQVVLFSIYDRWGNLIFEGKNLPINDPNFGWDGRFKSEKLNPGLFSWFAKVRFIDDKVSEYRGATTLVR